MLHLASIALLAAVAAPTTSSPAALKDNVLLQKWQGPHGGWPAFDKVKVADFEPALQISMAEYLKEIDAIANAKAAPTFENTLVALEKSGATYRRVIAVYSVWTTSLLTDDMKLVEQKMAPRIAALQDQIYQNAALFKRIEAVYEARAKLKPEQQRLAWLHWKNFVREGAKLDANAKARVAEINQQLAALFAKFSQNLQHDEDEYVTYFKNDQLGGLPQDVKDAAAAVAEEKGHKGEWAITNTRSSMDPFLSYSDQRSLREKVWRTYYSRGDNGDAYDNNKLITEILALRAERAKLLGYATHAHWRLEDKMAKTPENALALMLQVWPAAIARVREDVAEMQAIADQELGKGRLTIEPWDYRYYAQKLRKAKYDLDESDLKPYLQLDRVREAMFWAANKLYGFSFSPVNDVPRFHADVAVYQVKRAGKHVAYWYFDPYARTAKGSGAWEMSYRPQDKLGPHAVLVSNNSNFVKGKAGDPVLVSWDDATTMFHEFGHALHDMSSNVTYPSLAGTSTATDFVEFPSQVNENWAPTPEVLDKFLLNAKGEPMPKALVEKIQKAKTFNTGFSTTEYLAGALIDMKLHLAGEKTIDPDAFEKAALKELGMPKEVVMRHRTPQFGHAFGDDYYSAGYYSYLWSAVIAEDAYATFEEGTGPYDAAVAKKYFDTILSVGNSVDPADAFRAFRGRDPQIDAYLRAQGFPPAKK